MSIIMRKCYHYGNVFTRHFLVSSMDRIYIYTRISIWIASQMAAGWQKNSTIAWDLTGLQTRCTQQAGTRQVSWNCFFSMRKVGICVPCQAFTICCVTKATSIQFIYDKCHIRKWKTWRTGLAGNLYMNCPWGWTHTHTATSWTKAISRNQACTGLSWCVPGWKPAI